MLAREARGRAGWARRARTKQAAKVRVSSTTLCEDPSCAENLLGASPRKAAAQNTFLPLAAVALLMTATFGLVLSSGGQGTGRAAAVERNGVFGSCRSGGKRSSCSRAAGKLRSAALSMMC